MSTFHNPINSQGIKSSIHLHFSLIAHPVSIFRIQIFQIYVGPVKQTMWKKSSNVSLLSLHINWCEKVTEKNHPSALTVCFHAPFPYNSCHTNMLAMRHAHPLACVPACFGVFPMLKCGRAGKLFPVSERFILRIPLSSTQKDRQRHRDRKWVRISLHTLSPSVLTLPIVINVPVLLNKALLLLFCCGTCLKGLALLAVLPQTHCV